jgi:hypothetical protein
MPVECWIHRWTIIAHNCLRGIVPFLDRIFRKPRDEQDPA